MSLRVEMDTEGRLGTRFVGSCQLSTRKPFSLNPQPTHSFLLNLLRNWVREGIGKARVGVEDCILRHRLIPYLVALSRVITEISRR